MHGAARLSDIGERAAMLMEGAGLERSEANAVELLESGFHTRKALTLRIAIGCFALKVAVLKTKDNGDSGEFICSLMLCEAPARADSQDEAKPGNSVIPC